MTFNIIKSGTYETTEKGTNLWKLFYRVPVVITEVAQVNLLSGTGLSCDEWVTLGAPKPHIYFHWTTVDDALAWSMAREAEKSLSFGDRYGAVYHGTSFRRRSM
jgi:hypothetical protein